MADLNETLYAPGTSALFDFELNFDRKYYQKWMRTNWHVSVYAVVVYLFFVYAGQIFMAKRKGYQLRRSLVIWNALLAGFSILGALRSVPEMVYSLNVFGFKYTVCVPSFAEQNNVTAFWAWAFAMSKIPELVDTVFIILRKQKLIFLHYFHHSTVLLYCWFTYGDHPSFVRWFICLNYTVHGIMYTYFTLRALKLRIPRYIAIIVTTSQILQMLVGGFVCAAAVYFLHSGEICSVPNSTAMLGVAMYISYFVLFAQFFVQSYFKNVTKKAK